MIRRTIERRLSRNEGFLSFDLYPWHDRFVWPVGSEPNRNWLLTKPMVPKLPMRPVLRAGGCLALVTCRVFDYLRAGLLRSNIATPARISPYRYDNYRPRTCSPLPILLLLLVFGQPGIRLVSIIVKRSIDRSFTISVKIGDKFFNAIVT